VPSHLAHAQRGVAARRLSPVFRDRTDLPSATDLGVHIREALNDSASLLVICSPGASASRWVNEEIRYFRSLGRDDRIFCLIVDGEPNASVSYSYDGTLIPEAGYAFEYATNASPKLGNGSGSIKNG